MSYAPYALRIISMKPNEFSAWLNEQWARPRVGEIVEPRGRRKGDHLYSEEALQNGHY